MHWLYLAIAIVSEIVGTTALKLSDGFTRLRPSAIVVAGYGVAFVFLALALRTMSVGIAYAVWSGIGVTAIAMIGWVKFGQRLDAPALLGIGLIVAGVVVLSGFSRSVVR